MAAHAPNAFGRLTLITRTVPIVPASTSSRARRHKRHPAANEGDDGVHAAGDAGFHRTLSISIVLVSGFSHQIARTLLEVSASLIPDACWDGGVHRLTTSGRTE